MKEERKGWIGPYPPMAPRHADDVTLNELIRLRKLNDLYRMALLKVAQAQYNADAKEIANEALETGYKVNWE